MIWLISNDKKQTSKQFEKYSEQCKWYLTFSVEKNYLTPLVKANTFRKAISENKNLVQYLQNFAEEVEEELKSFGCFLKHRVFYQILELYGRCSLLLIFIGCDIGKNTLLHPFLCAVISSSSQSIQDGFSFFIMLSFYFVSFSLSNRKLYLNCIFC